MAKVEFHNINKRFEDSTVAVSDFSLSIADGEFMVFVGPSGCGKSTLLRILAGLEEPSTGDVFIGDQTVNDWTPQQRNVAMVFQNYALYPHMTVRRNLEFPLRMAKFTKGEICQRVEDTAELLGLMELLDRKPKQLSGGQRQRVAMGRAVVRNPSVFLMDEPLSNLDAKLRVQIRTEIAALQQRLKTTVVYVTHDQVEAMTLGSRVAVLNAGKLQQVAPPQDLYDSPANVFVASFLGNPGMNLFHAKATRTNGAHLILEVGQQLLKLDTLKLRVSQLPIEQELLVGVRPEALLPVTQESPVPRLEIDVETIESLGHEQLVYGPLKGMKTVPDSAVTALLSTAGHTHNQLVARLPSHYRVQVGENIVVGLLPERIHFFGLDGNLYR